MRKLFITICLLICALQVFAQEVADTTRRDSMIVNYRDSLLYIPVSQINDSLAGKSIYSQIGPDVEIVESESARLMADSLMLIYDEALQDCYRIRIFFDNKQNSRESSLAIEEKFRHLFPGFNTYRTFKSPFFKVTVGDFKSKPDAEALLKKMTGSFPYAFIVKESCKYPTIDYDSMFIVDTLKIPVDTVFVEL